MRTKSGWLLVFGVGLAGGILLWQQHGETASLREKLEQAREQNREWTRLQADNGDLRRTQISDAELEELRAVRTMRPQVQSEIAALRAQETARARAEIAKPAIERFSVGSVVPASDWKNVGTKTARAALETVLWAAAGGDVKTFADMLWLDPRARREAKALWEGLPEAMRAQYDTPEQAIAWLSIKDIPLGAVRIRKWSADEDAPANTATPAEPRSDLVQLLLSNAEGKRKDVALYFSDQGKGWKLVVMEGVAAKYAAQLRDEATTAGAAK